MTADTQPTGDSAALLSSYEEIRGEALRSAGTSRHGSGFVLFVRRGMSAWLAACAPLARPLEAHHKPTDEDRVPADLRTEVAMLLAEMALTAAHAQGVSTC